MKRIFSVAILYFLICSLIEVNSKGINLDDSTSNLSPSFSSFPRNWLNNNEQINSMRTYHYANNNRNWVRWAVQNNIFVFVGITLSDYQSELNSFSSDYNSADNNLKSQYDKFVIGIAVGNEQTNTGQINAGINYAKNLVNQKRLPSCLVTTVLAENTYCCNQPILQMQQDSQETLCKLHPI